MKIAKKLEGRNLIVSAEGRINTNTVGAFEKELVSLEGIDNLTFDFKGLEYLSSAGLRVLLGCQKKMGTQGNMVIKNACDNVKEIFAVAGFGDFIKME